MLAYALSIDTAMRRMLILEDHAAFRQALARLLEHHIGLWETVEAGSLAEARRLLSVATVDAAIVDLVLPDGDGADVIRQLRSRSPNVPVLALCPHGDLRRRAEAIRAGADEVLSKEKPVADILRAARRLAARPPDLNGKPNPDPSGHRSHDDGTLYLLGFVRRVRFCG